MAFMGSSAAFLLFVLPGFSNGLDKEAFRIAILPILLMFPAFLLILIFFRRHSRAIWLLVPMQWITVAVLSLEGLGLRAAHLLHTPAWGVWGLLLISISLCVFAFHVRQGCQIFDDTAPSRQAFLMIPGLNNEP